MPRHLKQNKATTKPYILHPFKSSPFQYWRCHLRSTCSIQISRSWPCLYQPVLINPIFKTYLKPVFSLSPNILVQVSMVSPWYPFLDCRFPKIHPLCVALLLKNTLKLPIPTEEIHSPYSGLRSPTWPACFSELLLWSCSRLALSASATCQTYLHLNPVHWVFPLPGEFFLLIFVRLFPPWHFNFSLNGTFSERALLLLSFTWLLLVSP